MGSEKKEPSSIPYFLPESTNFYTDISTTLFTSGTVWHLVGDGTDLLGKIALELHHLSGLVNIKSDKYQILEEAV